MSLGPWFKCYPDDFLQGMRDMDPVTQAFYVQLIFRMYGSGDAIYADDRTIGRWCNSNSRPWLRVRDDLIRQGRLVVLSDGGLINGRALEEMVEQSESKHVPQFIRERLAKLSDMFRESFGKDSGKIRETSPKTPIEPCRIKNLDPEPDSEDKSSECDGASPPPDEKADSLERRRVDTAYEQFVAAATRQPNWPVPKSLSKPRRAKLVARIREHGLDGWGQVIERAERSRFLTGQTDRPFALSLDWLLEPKNILKVSEGNFDDRTSNTSTKNGTSTEGRPGFTGRGPNAFDRLAERLAGGADREDAGASDERDGPDEGVIDAEFTWAAR